MQSDLRSGDVSLKFRKTLTQVLYSFSPVIIRSGDRGSTVVKVLYYKSEGRWFDPSWYQWIFLLTQNPSDRTVALGSTQPLTEISTRSISWG